MARKLSKSSAVHSIESYAGKWVRIKDGNSYSYYQVNFHLKEGSRYIFYYKEYLNIETKTAKNGNSDGSWYYSRVKKKDLMLTCVVSETARFQVFTTEQVNAVLDSFRSTIPVLK